MAAVRQAPCCGTAAALPPLPRAEEVPHAEEASKGPLDACRVPTRPKSVAKSRASPDTRTWLSSSHTRPHPHRKESSAKKRPRGLFSLCLCGVCAGTPTPRFTRRPSRRGYEPCVLVRRSLSHIMCVCGSHARKKGRGGAHYGFLRVDFCCCRCRHGARRGGLPATRAATTRRRGARYLDHIPAPSPRTRQLLMEEQTWREDSAGEGHALSG